MLLNERLGASPVQYCWIADDCVVPVGENCATRTASQFSWHHDPWIAYLLSKSDRLFIAENGIVVRSELTADRSERLCERLIRKFGGIKALNAWVTRTYDTRFLVRGTIIQCCGASEYEKRYLFSSVFGLKAVRRCDLQNLATLLADTIGSDLVIKSVYNERL